jgi:hypothetical protein
MMEIFINGLNSAEKEVFIESLGGLFNVLFRKIQIFLLRSIKTKWGFYDN